MKTLIAYIKRKVNKSVLLLLFFGQTLYGQNPAYLCELRNDIQVDPKTFEFDVYLLRTGSTNFELANIQFGILLNSAARNGGVISVSLVSGTSELNIYQAPAANRFSFNSTSNCIIMTAMPNPGIGNGTVISNSANGTRVGRIRIANSVNFGTVHPDLAWNFLQAANYLPTKVSAYVSVATDVTVQGSHTTNNLINPLLNPGLSANPSANPTTVCAGTNVQLNAGAAGGTGSYTYSWTSNPAGFTSTLANPLVTPNVSTTYTVVVADGANNVNSQVAVSVNPLPVVGLIGGGVPAVCINSTTPAFTNATVGGTWSIVQGTGTASITPGGVVTGLTAGTVTVRYTTAADGNGCTNSASAPLTVNPLPVPTITGTTSVCLNSTGNVYTTQTGMTGYSWSVSGGTITAGGTGTSNTATVTWTSTTTPSIRVNYINGNGCTAATPTVYNVTVNPLPVPTISGPASACLNSTGNVYTTQAGMTGYVWSVAGGTITAGGTGSNTATVTWTSASSPSLSVSYSNTNGCTAASPTVYNVTVNLLPVATISGPVSACLNSTGNVYTTQSGMTGYVWSVVGGTITAGGTGTSNTATVTWTSATTPSIRVNYTNGTGCTAASPAVYNVTVNSLPVPTISGPASACLNSTGNVYTTQSGMTGYVWSVVGGTITDGGTGTSNTATVTWTSATTPSIRVNYTNENGCTAASATVYNVTVNPLPVPAISGPASACLNSTGNLYTTQAGMTAYSWIVSGGTITAGGTGTSNTATVTWTSSGPGSISVNYTNSNLCTAASATVYNVTVNTLPVPVITGPASVCLNSSGNLYSTEAGMTGYVWSVTGGTITAGGTATSNTATITWNSTTTPSIRVSYINGNGCTAASPTVYNVTVNANPTITLGTIPAVCSGVTSANLPYSATTGSPSQYSIVFSSAALSAGFANVTSASLTSSPLALAVPASAPAASYTGTLTVTNSTTGCISGNYSITVAVNPTPAVTDQTTSIQTGSTFSLTPSGVPGGTTYTWTAPTYTNGVAGGTAQSAPQSNISGTLTIPSGTGTATYIVTPKTGNCTGANFNLVVTVTSNCVPVTIVSNPGNASLCTNSGNASFTVVAGETFPFVYQWQYFNGSIWSNVSNGTPAGAAYSNPNGATLGVTGITAAGSYQYRCYITNCGGSFNATSITGGILTVDTPPTAPNIGTITQPTCTFSTGSVLLTGLPAGNWTVIRTPGSVSISGTGGSILLENLPANTTYSFTVTNSSGCTSGASAPVLINPQPLIPPAPTVGTITGPSCTVPTGSVVLSGLPASGNWTLIRLPGAINTIGNGPGITVSGLATGFYNFMVKNEGGCTSTISATVEIPSPPAKPAAPVVGTITHSTCAVVTGSVVLSALPSSGSWTINPGGVSGSGTSTTIAGITSGTYNFTFTDAAGCTSLATSNVVIFAQPPTPVVPNQTTTISTGAAFTVTPAGVPVGTSYTWTAPSYTNGVTGGTAQTVPQSNITGTLTISSGTGTATYTVTPVAGACTGPAFTVTVTVTSGCLPVSITAQPSDNTMCSMYGNTPFTIGVNGSAPFAYQWQYYNGTAWVNVPNGTPSGAVYTNNTTATINVASITNAGNYQYRCIVSNCSGSGIRTSNSATLTVNASPGVPGTGTITQPTCSVATGSVVLNNLPTGNWIVNPGNIAGSTTTAAITGLAPGTYAFTVTNSLSCISSASSNVVINAQPAPPAAPTASVTQPTCGLATGAITITSPSAGTGFEYSVGGAYQSGTLFSGLAPGSYNVRVRNTTDNSCISASTTVTVNAQPLTPVVVITNPPAVCSPSRVNLTASAVTAGSTSGLTFTYWTNSAATIQYSSASSASAGTYYIKGTSSAGCYDVKPVIATVTQLPSANAGADATVCAVNYKLGAIQADGAGTGTWTMVSGPGSVVFSPDANTAAATVTVSAQGTYTFAWTEVSGTCSVSDQVVIIFSELPVVSAGNDAVICRGSNVQLQATGTGTFSWTPSALVNDPALANPLAAPDSPTNFTVTLTDQYGCVNSDVVYVDVWDPPAAFAGSDTVLNYIFKLKMQADKLKIHETGVWTLVSGSATFSNASVPLTQVTGLSVGENILLWTVSNGVCSPSQDYISIKVEDLVIPTIITPNGDPYNEYFVLQGLSTLGRTQLIIFDRRGAQVYKTDNYSNDWNGLDSRGSLLPDDTYFFTIKSQNGKALSGYVVIRR